jgi:hypothetical protein
LSSGEPAILSLSLSVPLLFSSLLFSSLLFSSLLFSSLLFSSLLFFSFLFFSVFFLLDLVLDWKEQQLLRKVI